jgi:glycosyltransferase involved in cell wall biosynthesis
MENRPPHRCARLLADACSAVKRAGLRCVCGSQRSRHLGARRPNPRLDLLGSFCDVSAVRIGIDLTALLPEATGVDVALVGLVHALARVDHESEYTVFVNREDRPLFAGSLPAHFSVRALATRPRAARLLFQQVLLPVAAAAQGLDVVHSPSFLQPMVRGTARHVLTVHDLTSFSRPQDHLPLRRSKPYLWGLRASIRRTDALCVPSEAVKEAIAHHLGESAAARAHVVPWGVADDLVPLPRAAAVARLRHLALPDRYILFVGTIEPRKNVPGLLAAYRALVARAADAPPLVLAGRLGWDYERVLAEIERPELRGRVLRLGYVDARDLPALYAGATLFAYPSLEEGFGFPPLEAMACGVPTIASAGSSLAENLAGAAELVPPGDVAPLADALERLLADERLRAARSEQGIARAQLFRWDESARRYAALYRQLAGAPPLRDASAGRADPEEPRPSACAS